MSPGTEELVEGLIALAVVGTLLALAIIGLYACVVRWVYWREHNAAWREWHDREHG